MKCSIPGTNVKVFGKAIHSLSKIGEELYVEPLEHGLALRTVNSSRSAYACFMFAPNFFLMYNDGSRIRLQEKQRELETGGEEDEENIIKCKINMKSCLTIFKYLSALEKTVDKCKIQMNMADGRLIFQLHCRHGIIKTYNLAFIECETLQAVFSKDLTPNVLTAPTRLLSEAVLNFQNNQEEISVIVDPESVCLKNYVEDEQDANKVVHTQMILMPEEFDHYQAGIDTEVTFCLKELRAILGFSEAASIPVSMHFERPGKPIIFSMESDSSFEANFVLATLADTNGNTQTSGSQASMTGTMRGAHGGNHANTQPSTSKSRSVPVKRKMNSGEGSSNKRQEKASSDVHTYNNYTPRKASSAKVEEVVGEFMNDLEAGDSDGRSVAMDTAIIGAQANGGSDNTSQNSSFITLQGNQEIVAAEESGYLPPAEEEDDEEVPGTPPRKTQFKSLFFGLSSQSQTGADSQPLRDQPMVLAEDTDDED